MKHRANFTAKSGHGCESCANFRLVCKCLVCNEFFCVECRYGCKGKKTVSPDDVEENAKIWEELEKFNK